MVNTKMMPVAKKGSSGRGNARSAITGRYVTHRTAAKNPRTTVVEKRKK